MADDGTERPDGSRDAPNQSGESTETDAGIPSDVVDEAERLTRLARRATDDEEAEMYRSERDELVANHDYRVRVREDDDGDVLVCYPDEWVADGLLQPDRIDDVDRGIERPLDGPGESDEWETVEEHNRRLVERIADNHGDVHAANAAAFADFMGNHYTRRMETATEDELEEFLTEYYPRNAWPSDEQAAVVEQSLRLVFETTGEQIPTAVRR